MHLKSKNLPSLLVCIGASAGGLNALEKLFTHLPEISGISFLVVTHKDSKQKSLLPELLSKHTSLQMIEVKKKQKLLSDKVYFSPPGRELIFRNGYIQLTKELKVGKIKNPIDRLLISVSENLDSDSYMSLGAVILSGTGNDGSSGLSSIKERDGLVIIQSPDSASYKEMPENAVRTGNYDFILKPEEIGNKIAEYNRIYDQTSSKKTEESELNSLKKILEIIRDRTGHDFSSYKKPTILRRIHKRMLFHHIKEMEKYLKYLKKNEMECTELFQSILIGTTNFFRDAPAFQFIKKNIISEILKNKKKGEEIRIWIAGCSTGEEAYSVAMIFQEYLDQFRKQNKIRVFATDIDEKKLKFARSGNYPKSIKTDVSSARLKNFFSNHNDVYKIESSFREKFVFSTHNLLRDPPFVNIDFAVCRNLLIYLDRRSQENILENLLFALSPEGYLFLGSAESLGKYNDKFITSDRKYKLFRKKKTAVSRVKNLKYLLERNHENITTYNLQFDRSKEELILTNEELSSINEELETSREEMQSLNEETQILNQELKQKVSELEEMNNDLRNFFESTNIATIFLDQKLKIRRFTRESRKIFNLIDTDVGRPLSDITSVIEYPQIFSDCILVMENSEKIEKDIQDKKGFWYLLQVLPYFSESNLTRGIVLNFIDITDKKKIQDAEIKNALISAEIGNLSRSLLSAENLDEICGLCAVYAGNLTESRFSTAGYFDRESEELIFPKIFNKNSLNNNDLSQYSEKHSISLPGSIIQNIRPELFPEVKNMILNDLSEHQFTADTVCIPILHVSELVGVICISGSELYDPSLGENIINKITYLFSIAVEKSRTETVLKKAEHNAYLASKFKSEFLANTSHELRTPLNGILGMMQLLNGTKMTAEQAEFVNIAIHSGESLLTVINDILDFSKIEAGKMELAFEYFDIRELVVSVMNTFKFEFQRKELSFAADIDPNVPQWVKSDRSRIRQILINLIGNAVKYTNSGSVILKASLEKKDILQIEINDTGSGIPTELISKIYEPFRQADGSLMRKHSGTGLGLSIAHNLIDLLDGTINIKSELHIGTSVSVMIPVTLPDNTVHSELKNKETYIQNRKLHILLADDNKINQLVSRRLLEKLGHTVVLADNGLEAVNRLRSEFFDCVFMDIQMPIMDGIEATKTIRSETSNVFDSHIPIIALTAHAMVNDRENFLKNGMNEVLTKPINLDDFSRVLYQIFS